MYKKVDSSMNFCAREKEVIEFWKQRKIFEKSVEKNKGKESFSFYDGPPTANGKPHIGHVLTRVIKDMIPRYRTMKGYEVPRKPTDCPLSLKWKNFSALTASLR